MEFIKYGGFQIRNYNLEKLCPLLAKPYELEKSDENSRIYKYVISAKGLDWTWFPTEWHTMDDDFFGLTKGYEIKLGYFNLDDFNGIEGVEFSWSEIEPMTQSEIKEYYGF